MLLARADAGPRGQKAPVGEAGVRGPDLLAIGEEPTVRLSRCGQLQRREVTAGVGLAEALAPDLVARSDRRQMLVLLPGVPKCMIAGPTQLTPMYCAPRGSWWAQNSSRRAVCSQMLAPAPRTPQATRR